MDAMLAQPTRGSRVVAGHDPNGDRYSADNGKTEFISTGKLIGADPISTIGDIVSINPALMEVGRPYGFVLGGVPLVIIKRKDGAADVYTTPAATP
jgi:hypothetical protein